VRGFMQANQQANISNGILFMRWSLMRKGTLIAWVLLVAVSVAQTPAFYGAGDLPGGSYSSNLFAISANGRVAVGWSSSANGTEACYWTLETGLVPLGDLPGGTFTSIAWGASFDGSVIVGQGRSASGTEAFLWRRDTNQMIGLGDLPGGGFQSFALGVSADGRVVVGWSSSANGSEAFRWTPNAGMIGLGDLPGGSFASYAQNVSANGRVIVGRSASFNGDNEAFRWENGNWQPLGSLGYFPFFSYAYGVSADGSVVVGWARAAGGAGTVEAFRWRADTGMVGLGELDGGGYDSRAYAVSADGRLVGGFGTSAIGKEAVIWNHEGMVYRVKDLLLNAGVTEVLNWRLEEVRAFSADGTVLVGTGTNPAGQRESWVAVLPRFDRRLEDIDLNGCIDDADLLAVLFAFGNTGYFDSADVNYDGVVDDADLLAVLFSFGAGC